jgi:hypothetical protein
MSGREEDAEADRIEAEILSLKARRRYAGDQSFALLNLAFRVRVLRADLRDCVSIVLGFEPRGVMKVPDTI